MKPRIIPDYEALEKCAWCTDKIEEESPVYGFGIKFRFDVDLTKYEGKSIELSILTQNKNIPMMITTEGSEAKKDGNDAMLLTCSFKCGKKLRDSLLNEKSLGDIFEEINSLDD